LGSFAALDPVADSYLREGLNCYVGGMYKAAAVMIGGAAESLILQMRSLVVNNLSAKGQPLPKGITDWRIKTVLDSLYDFLDTQKSSFPKTLREEFESYWLAFAQQIRATRNDAGHPTSVDPVTEGAVHASFLVFPNLARLTSSLTDWIKANV
jgi:hypothetical protein